MSLITLRNVSLRYPLLGAYTRSLKQSMLQVLQRGQNRANEHETIAYIDALKAVSFELKSGDRLGLVGCNGAGKSTLLKVLAGIYIPSGGQLEIHGSVSPLLGINIGLNPQATGYENIKFRCLLHGFDKKKTQEVTRKVEEFTELGQFLTMPVKTYSSGMTLRLSFAIATEITPDILVADEVVGVGDAQFMEKARKRLSSLIEAANIFVVASHSDEIIKKFCNKVLWLDQGVIVKLSEDVEATLAKYKETTIPI